MSYQAIAFDLDGTLLTPQTTILEENKQAILQAQAKGLKIFIVTGRHHTAVRPFYAQLGLDTPVVCCNGTYLYDFKQEKVLYSNPLSPQQAQYLINMAKQAEVHTAVYTSSAMTYEVLNPHFEKLLKWRDSCPENVRPDIHQTDFQMELDNGTTIWKVLISDPDSQKMQKLIDSLPLAEYSAEWSWIDRADISRAGNSKGNCLAELLKQQQIDPKNVIAFGDNFNDISMLQLVGMGVAMGESEEEVKQKADLVIGSNAEPSIAQTLTDLLNL